MQRSEKYLTRIKTGVYTGDGTESQAITGVGFKPKYLKIVGDVTTGEGRSVVSIDQNWGDNTFGHNTDTHYSSVGDKIPSLDADGFTVDDGGYDGVPNTNSMTFYYYALG